MNLQYPPSSRNTRPYHLPISSGRNAFRADVLLGLSRPKKSIPSKYLYDEEGSRLFEEITRTPEYYPTRTEKEILRAHSREIADFFGPRPVVIEPGSGAGDKIRMFLDVLDRPALYAPIEISRTVLDEMTARFRKEYPMLPLLPICTDYSDPSLLTIPRVPAGKRIVFFPGSTIGNLDPADAVAFLHGLSRIADGILVGVDTKKEAQVLSQAYNDRQGLTAEFNLNLLKRINRQLDANFDLDRFEHLAFYNGPYGRIEMHLVSRASQSVSVSGITFDFAPGETIHTESSYKYAPLEFQGLINRAGFTARQCWTDPDSRFSIHYCEKA